MNNTLELTSYDDVIDMKKKVLKENVLRGYSRIEYVQKRVIDYIIVSFLILFLWPVMLYTIYRIKKESPGPIFFKQLRVGLNGKKFNCYKFRSMHTDSYFDPYTQDNDSRIFPYGVTMRKMRIDELPQILNVIKGDMHMIGPRAEWDILVKKYIKFIPNYKNRHLVRPGITGLAQVLYPYGRNVADSRKKLKYDLLYIKKWSLWIELKVIIQTVSVILGRKGI
ncbi:MAG: sugar transferase [Sulfurovaceae bacterium]|nr:sugar transferase [Sulfurovaceae bacterium]